MIEVEKVKILVNGEYLEVEDTQEPLPEEPTEVNNQDALTDFLTGLSSPEITSIAKIRQLAKEFLERSAD